MLNDAKVRAAKPKERPYKLGDAGSLYLNVAPSGGKQWRMNYVFNGKAKTLSIGPYPAVSLVDARKARDTAKDALRDGRDPSVEKRAARAVQAADVRPTFEEVARSWHARHKPRWSEKHAEDVLHGLERDVFPLVGSTPIADLKPPKVLEVLRAIETRGAIETAKRTRQRMSDVFVAGIAEAVCEDDPAAIVKKALQVQPPRGRQPAITDLKELRQLMTDVEKTPAHAVTKLANRFAALTAPRPNEIRGMMWSELVGIDWSDDTGASDKEPTWIIPAARMKGDIARKAEKVGGEHQIPLSRQAVETLRALRPLTGRSKFCFPSARHDHRPMSENAIGYLLNRAGYHGRHVAHGYRAAFSTVMNLKAEREKREGDRAIIDLMLAHVPKNKVESAYNRQAYMERRREIAQDWADMLLETAPPALALLEGRRR